MLRQKCCIVTVRDKRSVMDLFTCMSGLFHFFLGGGGGGGKLEDFVTARIFFPDW